MSKLELEVQNTQSIEHLFEQDGWNRTARIGVVVPHADVGPEAEIGAMAGDHATVHGSRIFFSAMRAGGEMDDKIPHAPVESFVQAPYLDEAVEAVCQSPIDCVGLAFTSSAYKHGPDGERALIERLKPVAREIPIVSTCLSAERALKTLGTQKLAVVNPAWFDYDLSAQGASYFEKAGFNVVHHSSCGIQSGQKYVTPQALYTWIKDVVLDSGADTVFVGGNGQRSVGIIKAVEETLGVTMITGNQLILWDALRSIGSDAKIERYGRLFS
ncbi:maleate cis-trans isomerase [Vibrio coralliilyticus]|uniref:maleate cis-trans isomerase family protein n=1 Tax=Vibrio coralliilyticus TaxID=190893 RepID=UPI001560AA88|nr:maleate cis-trans isomerase [Vibrio coralliilyticus]NRF24187.1 maleate cis-trans isomerase [Vibrio coralliilyticus]NRF78015.1 maleate cis-trans isomerase [Vibrio coralliilyticus]